LLESERVTGLGAFELNVWDIGKKRHGLGLWVRKVGGKGEKRENRKP
jgi:hypothetical protein